MKKLNERHEKFCQLFAQGNMSWRAIMDEIGYKHNQSQFSNLKKMPKIQKRVAEIRASMVTDKVMGLSERLELLTDWIRDPDQPKNFRLQCMRELSEQDGSKVKNLNVNQTTENTIRYVDIELPKKEGQDKGQKGQDKGQDKLDNIREDALEGLEQFLMDVGNNTDGLEDLF